MWPWPCRCVRVEMDDGDVLSRQLCSAACSSTVCMRTCWRADAGQPERWAAFLLFCPSLSCACRRCVVRCVCSRSRCRARGTTSCWRSGPTRRQTTRWLRRRRSCRRSRSPSKSGHTQFFVCRAALWSWDGPAVLVAGSVCCCVTCMHAGWRSHAVDVNDGMCVCLCTCLMCTRTCDRPPLRCVCPPLPGS